MWFRQSFLRAATLGLIILTLLSCTLFSPVPSGARVTPTPTQSISSVGSSGGNGSGSGGSGGGGSGGSGSGGGNNGGSNNPQNTPPATPIDTPIPHGPYIVIQTETQGGESISGGACSLDRPFQVNVATPKIAFVIGFSPAGSAQGSWSYSYVIPKAGESHDGSGTYTIANPDTNGLLQVKMTGKDHVIFKGFDGILPRNYSFGLHPSPSAFCP